MANILRIDVPKELNTVHGNDGRVFIDFEYLVSEFEKVVDGHEWAANLVGESDSEIVEGERFLLACMRQNIDILALDAAYTEN